MSRHGATGVMIPRLGGPETEGVDIMSKRDGRHRRTKVKADAYCGTDAAKIADRSLAFYRREGSDYAFESISHHMTRSPGWVFNSDADDLYYYFLALGQPEIRVAALMAAPDDIFFSQLNVELDDLHVMEMAPLRAWFETNFESYTPRPVLMGDHSAWFRLVPREVLAGAVTVNRVGPVFAGLAP
jgi:hypothetical protein